MLKRFLSLMLVAAVMSQGIARADEPAQSADVMTVRDHTALLAHIEGLTAGDRVVVATAEGIVAGELVDKDGDDVVVDQPLLAGGAERIVIPLREIQGVRYQQSAAPQTRLAVKGLVVVAVVVGAVILLVKLSGLGGP
jgi:hypothetical protein